MRRQMIFATIAFLTNWAVELFGREMNFPVSLKMLRSRERLSTNITAVPLNFLCSRVLVFHMPRHRIEPHKLFTADAAAQLFRFVSALGFEVLVEGVRVGEGFVTSHAFIDKALQLMEVVDNYVRL